MCLSFGAIINTWSDVCRLSLYPRGSQSDCSSLLFDTFPTQTRACYNVLAGKFPTSWKGKTPVAQAQGSPHCSLWGPHHCFLWGPHHCSLLWGGGVSVSQKQWDDLRVPTCKHVLFSRKPHNQILITAGPAYGSKLGLRVLVKKKPTWIKIDIIISISVLLSWKQQQQWIELMH